jgi:hypothetical protein
MSTFIKYSHLAYKSEAFERKLKSGIISTGIILFFRDVLIDGKELKEIHYGTGGQMEFKMKQIIGERFDGGSSSDGMGPNDYNMWTRTIVKEHLPQFLKSIHKAGRTYENYDESKLNL